MVAAAPTQDLPPRGGYAPIIYKRIPAKTYFRGWHWFAGVLAVKCVAIYQYYHVKLGIKYEQIENRSARIAIQPLLYAEQDRGKLLQLRKNRDEEESLMADVPGWEVGKFFNEPVFKTIDPDQYVSPLPYDYFLHSHLDAFKERVYFHWYH